MVEIAIVVGSTRPGRKGRDVADWVYANAIEHGGAEFSLIDLVDHDLPLLDESIPPSLGRYEKEHTKAWARTIARFDGFVFVTAEYNHGIPGALKNALDFVYAEWNNKAAGFVGYGSAGGTRSVEALRLVMAELQVADVRAQVALSLFTDFKDMREFAPGDHHMASLQEMLDQVIAWSEVLRALRSP